jgi:Raf kinase inhibitor-like YbhB/YbcL family protein
MKKILMTVLGLFMSLASLALPAFAGVSPDGVWEELPAPAVRSALSSDKEPWIKPDVFRLFKLDEPSLAAVLNRAPAGAPDGSSRSPMETVQLTLPAPDGRFVTIVFTDTPIMAPELAARFPDIKTYTGYLADDPTTTVAFDWTPTGFRAQVLSAEGPWYIDPYVPGESYASYFKRDYRPDKKFTDYPALRTDDRTSLAERSPLAAAPLKSDQIRKYRLALACTAEYARYQCGGVCVNKTTLLPDKTTPMAAMTTTINRVNQIYKRELAIEFQLVDGNEKLIYLDPQTAPFTNGNSSRLIEQSQSVIDNVIGDKNYDIGHVFSLNGGGLSTLGVPCQSGMKARALTGTESPKGDAFDVDYVCHEMGHQFNADHTYNGKLGECSTEQYAPLMAYEPGSATTIMSYGGQCNDDNIQLYGDLTFHSGNFDQIQTYVAGKGSCYKLSETSNAAPVVDAGPNYTIPRNTPFTLTGTATDADNDPLTYLWEEFDLGGAQASLSEPDDGKMPLFRLYRPTLTGTRTFPKMETIASGVADKTEKLPQIGRTMNFRLIARDGKGGVAYGTTKIIVDANSGPLRVTSPAAGATVASSSVAVTWDVANTNLLPGASEVNIYLSTDGGYTFNMAAPLNGLTLITNNGSTTVTLPSISTERARIMVKASDNVFFAISGGDFKITGTGGALSVSPDFGLVSSGDQGGPFQNSSIVYTLKNTGSADINWSAAKTADWLTVTPDAGTLTKDGGSATATVTVSINATTANALARDQYQDVVVFTNTTNTNSVGTTTRPVVLIVGEILKEGFAVLEADGLDAWGFTGGPFLPSKTFTIRNVGMNAASWTAKTADWVTLSSADGTLPAGKSTTVTATINTTGTEPGSYTDTITFYRTVPLGSELVATRPVSLTIDTKADQGTLSVTPAGGLVSTGYVGGPFAPASKNFTLRNVGQTALSWTAAKTKTTTTPWLDVSPASGTLAAGTSATVTATINSAEAQSLTAGPPYTDTITFTNTTNDNGTTTRPVSLSISAGPGKLGGTCTTTAPFTFQGPRGGPFTQVGGVTTCTLKNTGAAPIDWIIYTQESWLDVAPYQGTKPLDPDASVEITISAASMARALVAGAHKNTLYFTNKTNGTGDIAIESWITVGATPAAGPLTVTPATGYTVSGNKGGPFTPASFDFTLRNTGALPLKWEYVGDAAWTNVPESTKGDLQPGASATFPMWINTTANLLSANGYRGGVYFTDTTNKMIVGRTINLTVKGSGDVNGDGVVDLSDAILALQVQTGQAAPGVRTDYATSGADVNSDNKVGHPEAVFALQSSANLRSVNLTQDPPYFVLKSDAFRSGQPIPAKYLAHGLSLPLSWRNAPAGTKSFVLILEDPDEIPALGGSRDYWIVYDIPATVTALAEGAGAKTDAEGKNKLPTGAKHGTTSWDKDNTYYHGLEPTPNTGVHRFYFRLYALEIPLLLNLSPPPAGTKQDKIEAAMAGKILGICELMGTYTRP